MPDLPIFCTLTPDALRVRRERPAAFTPVHSRE